MEHLTRYLSIKLKDSWTKWIELRMLLGFLHSNRKRFIMIGSQYDFSLKYNFSSRQNIKSDVGDKYLLHTFLTSNFPNGTLQGKSTEEYKNPIGDPTSGS